MEKELKEMLKNLNEVLGDLLNNNMNGVNSKIANEIEKAFKEEATISIKKHENGASDVHVEGRGLAVLITLAGLEKGILKKLHVPNEVWKMIKDITGAMEANNNE